MNKYSKLKPDYLSGKYFRGNYAFDQA